MESLASLVAGRQALSRISLIDSFSFWGFAGNLYKIQCVHTGMFP
jgi:hypothetical protein